MFLNNDETLTRYPISATDQVRNNSFKNASNPNSYSAASR